jgi:tight adherence protein C
VILATAALAGLLVAVGLARLPAPPRIPGRAAATGVDVLGALGRAVRAPLGRPTGADRGSDPAADRRRGTGVLVVAAITVAAPPAGALALAAWGVSSLVRKRRRQREATEAVLDELPDVVDLLRLATGAGLSLPLALPMVGRHGAGPVREVLAAAQADRARPLGDALVAHLDPLGPGATRLARALADHLRYGAALEPRLAQVGLEARADRRRHAEIDARRVPVRLLLPLVLCALPAFGLLTVVPLIAGSLQDLLG